MGSREQGLPGKPHHLPLSSDISQRAGPHIRPPELGSTNPAPGFPHGRLGSQQFLRVLDIVTISLVKPNPPNATCGPGKGGVGRVQ